MPFFQNSVWMAEKRFYMFVVIPKDNVKVKVDKGMRIFQNIGVFGVKTITYEKNKPLFC